MKIIYDDIIYSLQKSGGGSVYWTEVTKRQDENAIHNVYDDANENFFYSDSNFNIINKKSSRFLIFKRYCNLKFPEQIPFLFHSSLYRYCKNKNAVNITTIHDFTYEYYRKDLKSNLHKFQKKNSVMHSDGVICISENTKNDLLKFYPKYRGKIKVIYNGYSTQKYFYEKNIEKNKNVLFVGARTNYKRFDFAIDIISKLPNCKLVIVGGGKLSDAEKALLELKIPNQYEKSGYLSDDELRKLYNSAFFLLYPSEYEGFGIPVIEAQACGCPVVCQAKSSIPEVAGDSAIYIDSSNLTYSINKINKLLDVDFYNEIIEAGLKNVKRFSWDKCADEVKLFYEEVFNKCKEV